MKELFNFTIKLCTIAGNIVIAIIGITCIIMTICGGDVTFTIYGLDRLFK